MGNNVERRPIMKTKAITILAAVILSFTAAKLYAVPVDKIFTSSGQILDGEEWNNVSIYNDETIVDMLGGDVESIGTYDESTVNVTGGQVNTLGALEFSTANVSGGDVYTLRSWDFSTVNLSGTATVSSLSARSSFGTANIYGGHVVWVSALDSGTVNLYGGVISDYMSAPDGIINVFGHGLFKTPSGGNYGYGFVNGYWDDNTSFYIDLLSPETYSNVYLIPEPSSFLLLTLGYFLIKRKR
jgi:hypothetical protein